MPARPQGRREKLCSGTGKGDAQRVASMDGTPGLLRAGLSASETQAAQQASDTSSEKASAGTDLPAAEDGAISSDVSATGHNTNGQDAMEVPEYGTSLALQEAEHSLEAPSESGSAPLLKWDRPIVFR